MEISQTAIFFFCIASFVIGFLLGVFYDISAVLPAIGGKNFCFSLRQKLSEITLPIIKRKIKAGKSNIKEFTVGFTVFLHDLIFMIFSGAAVSVIVYRFNNGIWRIHCIVCIILGFAFYRIIFRYPVLVLAEILRFVLCCIVLYIICLLYIPIKALIGFITTYFSELLCSLKNKKTQRFIIKYSKKYKEELKITALNSGFLK